jgi:hypothetical protein
MVNSLWLFSTIGNGEREWSEILHTSYWYRPTSNGIKISKNKFKRPVLSCQKFPFKGFSVKPMTVINKQIS